ncbi:MAG: DUF2157 domain-containing protein [Betaproteobacteria bacterium]
MRSRRQILIDWMDQGLIAPQKLHEALSVAGVFPSAENWRHFLDRLLLWLGAMLLAAGVIFFFAYNWKDLGRYARFGLVEAPILAALIAVWRIGLDSPAGKATLLAASLFVGALLALIGQTYQTGADTFELFATWTVLILPWVLVGRLPALWLLWIGLLNLATIFYYQVFGGLFGFIFAPMQMLWVLFALNTIALVIWEVLAARGRRDRWAIRILATVSGALVTALAVYALVEWRGSNGLGLLAWLAYFAAAYVVYRHLTPDVYVLAGGVLSVIVVITTWLAEQLIKSSAAAGAMLFIGLIVIGLSAAGGWWLKRVVNEVKP